MSDYKRLTERSGKGICIKETSTNDNKSIWNAIERLAELEDMIDDGRLWFTPSNGLRPNPYECAKRWEELWYEANSQLNTLKNNIENGTLIELPCKVGDTVYMIWIDRLDDNNAPIYKIQSGNIFAIQLERKEGNLDIWLRVEFGLTYCCRRIKDFFLTKAEAEAKLKELKGKYDRLEEYYELINEENNNG